MNRDRRARKCKVEGATPYSLLPPTAPDSVERDPDELLVVAVGARHEIALDEVPDAVSVAADWIATARLEGTTVIVEGHEPGITDLVLAYEGTPPELITVQVTE